MHPLRKKRLLIFEKLGGALHEGVAALADALAQPLGLFHVFAKEAVNRVVVRVLIDL